MLPESSALISQRAPGSTLIRIHRRIHDPLYFDRSSEGRFNAPEGEFGVCYLGESLARSFVETLVRGSRHRLVPRADLAARCATTLQLVRPLTLFRLHSTGLVHLALSADFPHLVPYDDCQAMARNVWLQDGIDGIEYRSRWDDSLLCVALFDRAAAAVTPAALADSPRMRLDEVQHIRQILRDNDVGVI